MSRAGIFICLLKHDWNEFSLVPICGRRTVKSVGTARAKTFKSSLAENFGSGTKRAVSTKKGKEKEKKNSL